MVGCACGDGRCGISIRLDAISHALWFTDADGKETLMYLDPNAICCLIRELRGILDQMACEKIPSNH